MDASGQQKVTGHFAHDSATCSATISDRDTIFQHSGSAVYKQDLSERFSGCMPYTDKETQRAYQLAWMHKRRAGYVALHGGKCKNCGSDNDLEFNHIDPSQKVSHRIWSWRTDRILEELKKCELLCKTCHDKETVKQFGFKQYTHGTNTCYTEMPCRCQLCRDAVAADRRRQRAARQLIGV